MVPKQTDQTDPKHSGDKEQEHDVESSHATVQLALPELQEVAHGGQGHVETVQQGIAQEQYKEFVVGKINAVVYPGTVMVELKDTHATYTAVVRPVRFDDLTAVTETNSSCVCAIDYGQVLGHNIEDLFLLLFARRFGQFLQVSQRDAELERGGRQSGS